MSCKTCIATVIVVLHKTTKTRQYLLKIVMNIPTNRHYYVLACYICMDMKFNRKY